MNDTLHIVHLTPYYAPAYAFGGVARSTEGIAEALVKRGHTVTVLTTDAGTQQGRVTAPGDETRNGVRVLRAPNVSVWLRGRANLSTPRGLSALAHKAMKTADILHAH
ncbi:MAG: glycosyltransferase, partial [Chloroflexota bacterium]